MYSIKSSFADCLSCKLFESPSCILETNSPKNLQKVEVVFISENPGKDEIEKEVPLIGRAGQLFRKYFDKYIKKNFKWLLTNTVLCATINEDNTTGNPDKDVIERCKENCFKIIEACKPKLIVLMGTTPMSAFGIAETGITNLRGQLFKWNGYDVFIMLHPSFVNRKKEYEIKFEEDMKKVSELLGSKILEKIIDTKDLKSGVHYYKIPDKFYTKDYRLVDVQFLSKTNEVLYIFRDKDNNKVYHRENDDYYCYQLKEGVVAKKVVPYDDLYQVKIPYKNKVTLDPEITYEGDLKITVKHTQDYYLQKKEDEADVQLNTMFIDIETFKTQMAFPSIEEATDPIVIITYKYLNEKITFVVDPKSIIKDDKQTIRKDSNIIICKNEKEMLTKFIQTLRKLEPDVITGWSSNYFDLPYFINRCKKIGIDPSTISKFGQVYFELFQGYVDIAGCVCLDMLDMYKAYTESKKESYSLNAVSLSEKFEGKLELSSMFATLYKTNINRGIDYNIQDVTLLEELDGKLKHIHFQDELRRICKSSFRGARSSMGQLDSLLVSFLKEKGLSSKNAVSSDRDEGFEGAFVKEPIVGVHDYVVDFDFSSLYPSIIRTFNIGVNTFCLKLKDYKQGYDFVYDIENFPDKVSVIIDPIHKNIETEVTKEELINKIKKENLIYSINGCFFKKSETSFYSQILEGLVQSRKKYKNEMFKAKEIKDKDKEELYDNRQKVYKILANALYGILGNKVFRFFNVDCARTITLTGQEMIKNAILETDRYIDFLKTGKHIRPDKLTKDEIYGDLSRETKNVITGDTDSAFCTLKSLIPKKLENFDLIHKYSNEIQDFLNNKLVPEIISKYNIEIERNKLEMKNELIIRRGLFVSKKHYALYVVEQEGIKVDEIQVKGLDTRRSDYPSYSKECLQELFDIMLKTDTYSPVKINQFVNGKENDFTDRIKSGDKTIARPISWGKKLKDYKTITQGVRAMQNWNNLVYDIHNTGSKAYLFHIQGIDFDKAPKDVIDNYNKNFQGLGKKLDVVGLPEDEPRLPEYLIPDVKKMLEFSWKDRYKIILEPMHETKEKDKILKF